MASPKSHRSDRSNKSDSSSSFIDITPFTRGSIPCIYHASIHLVHAKTFVILTVLTYPGPFPLFESVLRDGDNTSAEASRRSPCATGGFATFDPVGRSKYERSATSALITPNPLQIPSTPRVHFKDHAGPMMVSPSSHVSSYIDNRPPWELHAPRNHPDAPYLSIREFVLNFPRLKDQKTSKKRDSAEAKPDPHELCDIDAMNRGFEYGRRFVQPPDKKKQQDTEAEPAEKEFKLDKYGCLVLQKPIYAGHRIKMLDPVTGDTETVVSSIDLDRPYFN